MKVIYKYRLPFMEMSCIPMHQDATIIRVEGLEGAIWIWAIVDTNTPIITRHFELYKTGGEMPEDILDLTYHRCGAIFIQMELMMYIFERPNSETPYSEPEPFDWKRVLESSNAN